MKSLSTIILMVAMVLVLRHANHRRLKIEYDAEWLAILRKTHNLTQFTRSYVTVPDEPAGVTDEEIGQIRSRIVERYQHRSQGWGRAR